MALRYKYKPQLAARRPDAGLKVIEWARALIGDERNIGVGLSVNGCGHMACAGQETVILLMRRDEPTVAVRISKSVDSVTETDVAEALHVIPLPARAMRCR